MGVLILGLVIFLGVHASRILGVRALVIRAIGEPLYAVFYSVVSAIGLALIVYGHILAHPSENIWNPPEWSRMVALVAIPISLILLVATYLPSHIRSITRHPMTLAVALWSGSHLLANGEVASIALFGAFFAWSVILLIDLYARGGSFDRPGRWWADLVAILVGLGAATVFALFHMQFFGVAVIGFASETTPPGI
jgi:uncharacterized membrane protein